MENHYFDKDGRYLGSAPANPGSSPPANALRTPPPQRPGFLAVITADGDGWELVPEPAATEEPRLEAGQPSPAGEALRKAAYRLRADPLLDEALSFRLEAEGWALAGEAERAERAEQRCRAAIRAYLAEKETIRREFPSDGEGTAVDGAAHHGADPWPATDGPARRACYFLAESGVYHGPACTRIGSRGKWLREDDGRLRDPQSRPCQVCRPPAPEACREW